jgi:excisionase family DNA binding protein
MVESQLFSPKQVASALGVSETTVKRWVDDAILPATRTPGGHRKILGTEVMRLVQRLNLPALDLGRLHLEVPPTLPSTERLADELHAALKLGSMVAVRALFTKAYHAGLAIEELADRVIAPAMRRLGHDWETGRIDVYQEHRGTQLCTAALYELKPLLEPQIETDQPVALGGAPEGDPYRLPSLLAQMALLDRGWNAVNLGPNTPVGSFRRAVLDLKPRLLWISFSYLPDPETFLAQYPDLYQATREYDVTVVVGGQALTPDVRSRLKYAAFGDGISNLVELATRLHSLPRPARRGRPARS